MHWDWNPLVYLDMSNLDSVAACLSSIPLVKAVVMQFVKENTNLIGGHILQWYALGGEVAFWFVLYFRAWSSFSILEGKLKFPFLILELKETIQTITT